MNWLFGKKEKTKTKTQVETKPHPPLSQKEALSRLKLSGKYGAVTIARCGCRTASQLVGQYFAFEYVPSLPLPGCSADQCTCEYQGILERRQGSDMRKVVRRSSLRMEDDRRKACRRKEDKTWDKNDF